jgi:hypothetical protein
MWLSLLVIFAALSPGVLFTIPSLGKKMGGKVMIAAMHALLFVIVVKLLYVVQEGFQGAANLTTQKRLDESISKLTIAKQDLTNVRQKLTSAEALYNSLNTEVGDLRAQLAKEQSMLSPAGTPTAAELAAYNNNLALAQASTVASPAGTPTAARIAQAPTVATLTRTPATPTMANSTTLVGMLQNAISGSAPAVKKP